MGVSTCRRRAVSAGHFTLFHVLSRQQIEHFRSYARTMISLTSTSGLPDCTVVEANLRNSI